MPEDPQPIVLDLRELAVETREHPDDAKHRREQDQKDADIRRKKDLITYYVGMTFFITTTVMAAVGAFASSDAETTKWSQTLLTSYAVGILAFLVGKTLK